MNRPAPIAPQLLPVTFLGVTAAAAPVSRAVGVIPAAVELRSVNVMPTVAVAAHATNYWTIAIKSSDAVTTYATGNSIAGWPITGTDITISTAAIPAGTALIAVMTDAGTAVDQNAASYSVMVEYAHP